MDPTRFIIIVFTPLNFAACTPLLSARFEVGDLRVENERTVSSLLYYNEGMSTTLYSVTGKHVTLRCEYTAQEDIPERK